MSIADRIIYQRPEAPTISVVKTPVDDATCPSCGSDDIARYPIGWVRGPRIVVKCQSCYESLSVERPAPDDRWPPFRSVTADWDVSVAERPNAR